MDQCICKSAPPLLSLSLFFSLSPDINKRGHMISRTRALTSLEILYPGQERAHLCPFEELLL